MNQINNGKSEDLRPGQGRRSQKIKTSRERRSTDVQKNEKGKAHMVLQGDDGCSKELQQKDIVVLRVGGEKVGVEKETLVASSEYFKALFSGHFADSGAKELDLTKDVEKIEDLRLLLDFISNGEVEITEDNLSQVFRVSSYFLVDSLSEKCAKFLSETTSLENCMQHYLIASNYALPKHETRKFELLLETRFHDLIIYEEDVAAYLNDEELKQLMTSGIMKFCSKESLFNFLLKWLSKCPVLTDKQFRLVSDIIEYFEHCKTVQTVPFQCDKKKTIANLNRMMVNIRKSCDPEILQKLRQLFNNFLRNKEHILEHLDQNISEMCVGIFTFSKKTRVNRESGKDRKENNYPFSVPQQSSQERYIRPDETLDLCVYQPDSRVWFHIATFDEDRYFSQIDGRPYRPTADMRQRYPATIFCKIIATDEEFLFCDISNKFRLVMYNFKTRRWTDFNIRDIRGQVDAGYLTHYQFEIGRNGVIYLITRNTKLGTSEVEFRGCTCDLAGLAVQHVFSTGNVGVKQGDTFKEWSQMTVKLSAVSNELIILCTKGVGDNLVILVDLENEGKVQSYTLLHKVPRDNTAYEELLFVDVDILETDDRFLVVSSANGFLNVKYQYKFRSRIFEVVDDGPKCGFASKCETHGEMGNRSHFRDSFWEMDEEYGLGSVCRKITFNTFGEPDVEYHTPPPFVDIISVYATQVKKSMFWDLEPVRHFLELPKKSAHK